MSDQPIPHIVILPMPFQGHIKPLLCLAELLSEAGPCYVTFVNTHQNHKRLNNLQSLSTQFPNLHFTSISDGFPDDHPRNPMVADYFFDMKTATKPHFKELLLSFGNGNQNPLSRPPPVTCIIADTVVSYPIEVAEELGIPIFSFCVYSPRFLWTFYNVPKLIELGVIPFSEDNVDMNYEINCLPGLEGLLRRKDLPQFCELMKEAHDPLTNFFVGETLCTTRTSGVILNTFDELEGPCLPHLASFCKIYTLGPLHALLNTHLGDRSHLIASHGSIWTTDDDCIKWLDEQPSRSVIYVSFGSMALITQSQLLEIWHGLVESGQRFLWVIRPDSILGREAQDSSPVDLTPGPKEKGYIVGWTPQERVLVHRAVGVFLSHGGWNSILESIVARVPLICRPYLADQFIITNCVTNVWKVGVELAEFDRSTIRTAVETLMVSKREEIKKSMDEIACLADKSIDKGGSSYKNLQLLLDSIKKMSK